MIVILQLEKERKVKGKVMGIPQGMAEFWLWAVAAAMIV